MLNVECSLLNHQIGTRDINHLWLTLGRLVATCIIYSFSLRRHRRGYFTISYLLVVAMVGAVLPAQTCKRFLAMLKCIVHFSEKAYKYFRNQLQHYSLVSKNERILLYLLSIQTSSNIAYMPGQPQLAATIQYNIGSTRWQVKANFLSIYSVSRDIYLVTIVTLVFMLRWMYRNVYFVPHTTIVKIRGESKNENGTIFKQN